MGEDSNPFPHLIPLVGICRFLIVLTGGDGMYRGRIKPLLTRNITMSRDQFSAVTCQPLSFAGK